MITIEVKKKICDTEFSVVTTVENKEEAKRELKELHDVIKVTDDLFPTSLLGTVPRYTAIPKIVEPFPQYIAIPKIVEPSPQYIAIPKIVEPFPQYTNYKGTSFFAFNKASALSPRLLWVP